MMLNSCKLTGLVLTAALGLMALTSSNSTAVAGRNQTVSPFVGSYAWKDFTDLWDEDFTGTGWVEVDSTGKINGELYSDVEVLNVSGSISPDGGFSLILRPYNANGKPDKKNYEEKWGSADFDDAGNIVGYYYGYTGIPYARFIWSPQ